MWLLLILGAGAAFVLAKGSAPGGGGGAPAAPGTTLSGPDLDALRKTMDAAAAKDAADQQARKDKANAQLDDWGKAVDKYTGTPLGSWDAKIAKMALWVEGKIVQWVQGDWNSDAQKQRALDAVKRAIAVGIPPEPFNADEDFAKTYADDLEEEIRKATSGFDEPWRTVYKDFTTALLAAAGRNDARVLSLFVKATGAYSKTFGTPNFCAALAQATGASNPTAPYAKGVKANYALANLVAAVGASRYPDRLSFGKALSIAYAAIPLVAKDHATICSGRGYKGDANTFDYEYAPFLYVLRAWIDMTPAGLHKAWGI